MADLRKLLFSGGSIGGADIVGQVTSESDTQDLSSFSQVSRSSWHVAYPHLLERFCSEGKISSIEKLLVNAYLHPTFFQFPRLSSRSLMSAWKRSLTRVIKTINLSDTYLVIAYTLLLVCIKQQEISPLENFEKLREEEQHYQLEFDVLLRLFSVNNADSANAIKAYLAQMFGHTDLYQHAVRRMREPIKMCEGLSHNEVCVLLKPFFQRKDQVVPLFNRAVSMLSDGASRAVIRGLFAIAPAEVLPTLSNSLFERKVKLFELRKNYPDECTSISSDMLVHLPQEQRLVILDAWKARETHLQKDDKLDLFITSVIIFLMKHAPSSYEDKMDIFHRIPFYAIVRCMQSDSYKLKLFATAFNEFVSGIPSSLMMKHCLREILLFLSVRVRQSAGRDLHLAEVVNIFSDTFSRYSHDEIEEIINTTLRFVPTKEESSSKDSIHFFPNMAMFISCLILALPEAQQATLLDRIFPLLENPEGVYVDFGSRILSGLTRCSTTVDSDKKLFSPMVPDNVFMKHLRTNSRLRQRLCVFLCNELKKAENVEDAGLSLCGLIATDESPEQTTLMECVSLLLAPEQQKHSDSDDAGGESGSESDTELDEKQRGENDYVEIDERTAHALLLLQASFKPNNRVVLQHLLDRVISKDKAASALICVGFYRLFQSMDLLEGLEVAVQLLEKMTEMLGIMSQVGSDADVSSARSRKEVKDKAKVASLVFKRNMTVFMHLLTSYGKLNALEASFLDRCYGLLTSKHDEDNALARDCIIGLLKKYRGTPSARKIYSRSIKRMKFGDNDEIKFADVIATLDEEFMLSEGIPMCCGRLVDFYSRYHFNAFNTHLLALLTKIPSDSARIKLLRVGLEEERKNNPAAGVFFKAIATTLGLVNSKPVAMEMVRMLLSLMGAQEERRRDYALGVLYHVKTQHLSDDLFPVFFGFLNDSEFRVRKAGLAILSRMIQCLSVANLKILQMAMSDPGDAFFCAPAVVVPAVFSIHVLLDIGKEKEWNLSKKQAEAKRYIQSHLMAASTIEGVWQIKLVLLQYQSELGYLHDPVKEGPMGELGLFAKEWVDETGDSMVACSVEWVDIMNAIKAKLSLFDLSAIPDELLRWEVEIFKNQGSGSQRPSGNER